MEKRVAETKSAAQVSAGAAASARADRFRLTLVTGGILLALALAVVLLRLQRLTELPPGLDAGEGANGLDALRVLQGEHAVYFPEKFAGREGLAMYAIALTISLFGRTEFALRLPTALASAGTVFVVFWLGYILFELDEESGRSAPWRGIMIGGVGAGLIAVSLGQTIMGRTAFRTSWLPLFLCLCLAFVWQGWSQRDRGGAWWRLVLAGVFAGLLPYTYLPARFVPFLFLALGLSFLLPLRAMARKGNGKASLLTGVASAIQQVSAEVPRLVIFAGVAVLVAAPILVHFALHPEHFVSRSSQVWVFDRSSSQGDPMGAFLVNVWDHLLVFGFRGDPMGRHNYAGRPMLNPVEALFFWLGVGMAVWRWQRRPAYRLLLLWLFILTLPAILSRDIVPNTLRMIGAAPAVYLLIAVGMWEAFRFLKDRYFRDKGTQAALAAGCMSGVLILAQGVNTYRTYFQDWAAASVTYSEYQTNWTELARALEAQPPAANTVFLIPGYTRFDRIYWQNSFAYLYQGTSPTHVVSAGAFNLAPAVESMLAAMQNIPTVKFVDWDNVKAGGDSNADGQIIFLFDKYGRFQGSEEGPSFRIHTYTDLSLDRHWTFYDYLEPLAVHYDGGISLRGFAWGQGTEQRSSSQPYNPGQDEAMWVAMQWEIAPGLEVEYSISLRLHNVEGEVVYQQDGVLRNSEQCFYEALVGR